ncbi:ArsA-related P-loop ATPase, partial [Burkholderia ambifaria]|uniref:ArsA-related P-loop ATPase n=1 Tax=Burkholderia ambifaria TaxID=152480 RepID=UPI002445769D
EPCSTTDPASHVAATVDGVVPRLSVTRIDPAREVPQYTEEVLAKAGSHLDAGGRAMLEEDLRSPCTEEIAVFRAFARTVDQGKSGFVVLDTAPTGHTILLLEAERLSADLARAGITPYAWVINQSLLASGTTDPMLCQRGTYEVPFVRRV